MVKVLDFSVESRCRFRSLSPLLPGYLAVMTPIDELEHFFAKLVLPALWREPIRMAMHLLIRSLRHLEEKSNGNGHRQS